MAAYLQQFDRSLRMSHSQRAKVYRSPAKRIQSTSEEMLCDHLIQQNVSVALVSICVLRIRQTGQRVSPDAADVTAKSVRPAACEQRGLRVVGWRDKAAREKCAGPWRLVRAIASNSSGWRREKAAAARSSRAWLAAATNQQKHTTQSCKDTITRKGCEHSAARGRCSRPACVHLRLEQ